MKNVGEVKFGKREIPEKESLEPPLFRFHSAETEIQSWECKVGTLGQRQRCAIVFSVQ